MKKLQKKTIPISKAAAFEDGHGAWLNPITTHSLIGSPIHRKISIETLI